jgi:hypothetical protein
MPETFTTGSEEEAYLPIESCFGNVGYTRADPAIAENVALPGAVKACDEADGAISYVSGPRSLIDHIFRSRNLAARFGADQFTIVAVDKVIPRYVDTISNHRPVMIRLHIATGLEEGIGVAGIPTPDWLRL